MSNEENNIPVLLKNMLVTCFEGQFFATYDSNRFSIPKAMDIFTSIKLIISYTGEKDIFYEDYKIEVSNGDKELFSIDSQCLRFLSKIGAEKGVKNHEPGLLEVDISLPQNKLFIGAIPFSDLIIGVYGYPIEKIDFYATGYKNISLNKYFAEVTFNQPFKNFQRLHPQIFEGCVVRLDTVDIMYINKESGFHTLKYIDICPNSLSHHQSRLYPKLLTMSNDNTVIKLSLNGMNSFNYIYLQFTFEDKDSLEDISYYGNTSHVMIYKGGCCGKYIVNKNEKK